MKEEKEDLSGLGDLGSLDESQILKEKISSIFRGSNKEDRKPKAVKKPRKRRASNPNLLKDYLKNRK